MISPRSKLLSTLFLIGLLGCEAPRKARATSYGSMTCFETNNPSNILSNYEFQSPQIGFIQVAIMSGIPFTYYPDMTCTWDWTTDPECEAFVYFPFCWMEGSSSCGDSMVVEQPGYESSYQMCGGDITLGRTYAGSQNINGVFTSNGAVENSGCFGILLKVLCNPGRKRRRRREEGQGDAYSSYLTFKNLTSTPVPPVQSDSKTDDAALQNFLLMLADQSLQSWERRIKMCQNFADSKSDVLSPYFNPELFKCDECMKHYNDRNKFLDRENELQVEIFTELLVEACSI